MDIVAITESWLHKDIDDNLLSISGYNIHRNDRTFSRGGGVCVYCSQNIPCQRRFDLENPNFECIWLWVRPTRLPRPLSAIAVCVVYNPPGRTAEELVNLEEYLTNTIDSIRNRYPDCRIMLLGDFNNFDVSNLTRSLSLKQIVSSPTRGLATLDLIITDLYNFYDKPRILAPLGSADHSIVQLVHNNLDKQHPKPIKRFVRRYSRPATIAFGHWASTHRWFEELGPNPSVDDLANSFSSHVSFALDVFFPLKSVRFCYSDKPWMSVSIKRLINERQRAFHSGLVPQWKTLKYKVQTEISLRKKEYYRNKVQHLRKDDCRKWWQIVNKMSGRSQRDGKLVFEKDGRLLSDLELADNLNKYYISTNMDIPPLDMTTLPTYLPAMDQVPYIEPYEVCEKLVAVNPSKTCGPDNIPGRILKEFAHLFAEPVANIFNTSLSSGVFPKIWKDSHIIPIPKIKQPTEEEHTRPISLTPCISKVLEDFVVHWMISDVGDNIDSQQFGSLKGSSTTYCLLDMLHTWLRHLDSPGHYLRVCFLDFSKAFDRIGHNVLIQKLVDIGVRRSLIPWIVSFLSGRRQCVKLGEAISSWLPVKAGVPQGTKLGPILFVIMVNDLQCRSGKSDIWKYVDDITLSEGLQRNVESSAIQSDLTSVDTWASNNLMKLNAEKCKVMLICFFRNKPDLPNLCIGDQTLECVSSYKVLGLTIQDDLRWNNHIAMIVTKTSKRLHILRVLRRGGIPPHDLIAIYYALIRPILEYCCPVWHCGLPKHLSEQIEKVQKRALRIILPGRTYCDALELLKCSRLDVRRNKLCEKTMKKIALGDRIPRYLDVMRENEHLYNLRNFNQFTFLKYRTDRFGNSFFPSMINVLNNN